MVETTVEKHKVVAERCRGPGAWTYDSLVSNSTWVRVKAYGSVRVKASAQYRICVGRSVAVRAPTQHFSSKPFSNIREIECCRGPAAAAGLSGV